jgi:hypothetical protein
MLDSAVRVIKHRIVSQCANSHLRSATDLDRGHTERIRFGLHQLRNSSTVPGRRAAIHRSNRWWTTAWRASRSWHRRRGRQ